MWNYVEEGSGRPLILLHGIGMSHTVWKPVMPFLKNERRVIAFDTAGFGATPPLEKGIIPTVANLVDALERCLKELGLDTPVDIAGNSLGGRMALEAAKRGLARSVVAISPPGLWKEHESARVKHTFFGIRGAGRIFPRATRAALRNRVLRGLMLAVPISLGSGRMPAEDAVGAIDDLVSAPGFEATFYNLKPFTGGQSISIPITVAFGTRDWILPRSAQRREELPPHTRWLRPKGWGHVPMWVDPEGVARLVSGDSEMVNGE